MMPNREKVIRGLECCIRHGENAEVGCGRKDECPYEQNGLKCWIDLNRDALALLKEQDPVPAELEGGGSSWWWVCGECHGQISKGDRYCRHCGHEIKWE